MQFRYILPAIAVVGLAHLHADPPARAAGRVQLQLVGEGRGSALDFQQWMQALSRAGIKDVRLRSSRPTDRVGIEVLGTESNPLYVVTGMVKSSELVLPGGRYRRSDLGRLAQWLDKLARFGPDGGGPAMAQGAFGLSAEQFAGLREDLAQPVAFSTKGVSRDGIVRQIVRQMSVPVAIDPGVALAGDAVGEELQTLSYGTVLAYVLRPLGYCVVPRAMGRQAALSVAAARPNLEVWPVGWEPEKPRRDVLPALFEFHSINVQGVSASLAMQAIGLKLGVPVLVDHNALARHGVEPDKVMVSHPRSQSTYGSALKKMLVLVVLKSRRPLGDAR